MNLAPEPGLPNERYQSQILNDQCIRLDLMLYLIDQSSSAIQIVSVSKGRIG